MSPADLLDYNFYVPKLILLKRGFQVCVALFMLMVLSVSSNWAPLIRTLHLADMASKSGDKLSASTNLAYASKFSLDELRLLEQAGIYAFEAGDPVRAKDYLERVQIGGLLSPEGYHRLGDIAHLEGNLHQSIDYWTKALQSQNNEQIYRELLHAYQLIDDWENAILIQKALTEQNPDDPANNYRLGLMLAATQPDASLAYLTLAGELSPPINSKVRPILRNLRTALNSGDSAYVFVTAGQALAALDEWQLASIAFARATELNPEYADAWAFLGESQQQIGEDGLAALEKAVRIDPESSAANTFLALYWQRRERYDLALVYLYAAASLEEDNPALQAEIGNTLALLGNITAAESHYLQAAEIDPEDPVFWRTLANFYIRFEIDIREKAAPAARQAVILAPDDPQSLDLLGQIYLLQDNHLLARRFLERSLSADSEYAPAHLHFGLVNLLENNSLGAYQHFNAAISLSAPDSPTTEQAQRLLDTHFP